MFTKFADGFVDFGLFRGVHLCNLLNLKDRVSPSIIVSAALRQRGATRYRGPMFVRRTQTRRTADGKPYFSHRLVHAERLGSVRQRLNLGRHFDIPQAQWPLLCNRVADALAGQAPWWPAARRRPGGTTDRRAVARGAATVGPADVQARRRLAAPRPTPQRRRRAGRPVGARASGADLMLGRQRRPACRRGRPPRRAPRPAGFRARDAPVAAAAQWAHAALPRLGRAGDAS